MGLDTTSHSYSVWCSHLSKINGRDKQRETTQPFIAHNLPYIALQFSRWFPSSEIKSLQVQTQRWILFGQSDFVRSTYRLKCDPRWIRFHQCYSLSPFCSYHMRTNSRHGKIYECALCSRLLCEINSSDARFLPTFFLLLSLFSHHSQFSHARRISISDLDVENWKE